MERPPTTPEEEEEEEEMKVSAESPKKAIFYIHHPSHFLQQFLRSLFKCLGFHEISVTNNDDSKGINALSGGADYYSGRNNHAAECDQDDVVASSPSQQASDPPSTSTDQQIGPSALLAKGHPRRPGPTRGPGPQNN